jgi:hypothetical protein
MTAIEIALYSFGVFIGSASDHGELVSFGPGAASSRPLTGAEHDWLAGLRALELAEDDC